METLLKWLNKPKADDKSLLARFFHADRALAAVASELDSFDGRAEPDRCSRLVSRLRQGQDKVLAITSLIIEELLGDERDPRAFRAKFPEEVLQENLAGQLWFGAECLAAGSSIMNREQESKEMRPLAEAVTRSLNNVRYLLRDQCLRNNVPNSERLNLDKNDAATEQLYESLKRFDRLFAEFEWRYVSAMVQVKSKEEYEMQELICVLCSETLQRALKQGLLEQEQVDAFDPALMFSIPRLAIVSGLVIYPNGPLDMDMPAEQLSEMFRPFRSLLITVREYLRNLNETELYYLERLLCTNEEISLKETLKSKDSSTSSTDNNNINTKSSKYSDSSQHSEITDNNNEAPLRTNTTSKLQHKSCKTLKTKTKRRADSPSPAPSTTSTSSDDCLPYTPISSAPSSPKSSHSLTSTTTAEEESNDGTTSPDSWIDDDDEEEANDNDVDGKINKPCLDEDDHYADDDDSDVDNDVCDNEEQGEIDDDEGDEDNKQNLDRLNNTGLFDLDNVVEHIMNLEMASADCATGYLISNTTLGNLLQPQEVPLTDNFVVSDADLTTQEDCNDNLDAELPTTSSKAGTTSEQHQTTAINQENQDNNNSVEPSESLSSQEPDICIPQVVNQSRRRRYYDVPPQTGSKDNEQRTQRHHHRHHHHHHHRHHHTSSQSHHQYASNSSATSGRHRLHSHHHNHHNHPRRPHRHGAEKQNNHNTSSAVQCEECSNNATKKEDTTMTNSKTAAALGLDIETPSPSSSSSLLDDNKSIMIRSGIRMKFKSTENLLHRLFVCIAGVADQLQTNFAFDLRQILRSVFLINMSPAQEELDIPEKTKDNELFEFRASENDVIQESAGSSQSIYSAEEVNPEGDTQSQNSNCSNSSGCGDGGCDGTNENNRVYRHSTGNSSSSPTPTTAVTANSVLQRQQIERSRSLDNQELSPPATQQQQQITNQIFRSRHHSTGSNTTPSSLSSSENNSPVCERSMAINATSNHRVSEANANLMDPPVLPSPPQTRPVVHLSPPAWIPDQKAPRCMSCNTPFTAFRRRHHCRNCGGVFCGVCSNTSAPLPKYGLTKAVRVCRACYVHELGGSNTNANAQHHHHNQQQQHHNHHHHHHSQLVSQATANNEPSRLRRPVTTTRAID